MSRDEFRSRYFEQQPFVRESAINVQGYSWDLIDRALDLQDTSRGMLKLLRGGRLEPEVYLEDFIDIGLRRQRIRKDRLYDLMAGGATLVLNRIELVSAQALDLCMQVGRFVGTQTSANAYASFGTEPATNVHWDTHDVLVIQLSGEKQWRVYEPTLPLPISSQVSNDRKHEVSETPCLEKTLQAGDIMYVPRGWWHRVSPTGNRETLHLTIAIHAPLVLDYLIWACATKLPDRLSLRHSLLGEGKDMDRVQQSIMDIAGVLTDPATLDAFYDRSRQRERVISPFNFETLFNRDNEPLLSNARIRFASRHASMDDKDIVVNGVRQHLTDLQREVADVLLAINVMTVEDLRAQLSHRTAGEIDAVIKQLVRGDLVYLETNDALNNINVPSNRTL